MKRLIVLATVAATCLAAATPASAGLSGPEKHWVRSLIPLVTSMSTFSGEIAKDAQDPTVLTPGSQTQMQLAFALAGYRTCSPTVARAGQPPTARLGSFRQAMVSGCAAFGRAAVQLASGIDHANAASLWAAAASMGAGTTYMQRANSLLLSLH
jgi:hypothetical protein